MKKEFKFKANGDKIMEYTVKFYKDGSLVCTCTKYGESADEAMINAEFALICKYPNVEYDSVEV